MKKRLLLLCLLLSIFSYGQKKATFFQMDSLLKIDQPNAAKDEFWKIIKTAEKEKDTVTLGIAYQKALQYNISFFNRSFPLNFAKMWKEMSHFPEPAKSLAKLQLVEMTMHFLSHLSSNFYLKDSIDISNQVARAQFIFIQLQEMEKKIKALQHYGFSPYKKVLTDPPLSEVMRTVGDYIAYKLIHFYQSSTIRDYSTLKMATSFQKEWFATAPKFTKIKFENKNLTTRILRLYQKIEEENLNYQNYLSDAVYQRLYFLQSSFPKNKIIKNAWQEERIYFKNTPYCSRFIYELAKIDYNKGKTYDYQDNPSVEPLLKKAHDSLTTILKKYPKSIFHSQISGLIAAIESPSIQLQFPALFPTGKRIPLLITSRNRSEEVIRVFKVNDFDPLHQKELIKLVRNKRLTLQQTIQVSLKNNGFFQKRGKELLLNAVKEPGRYIVVATSDTVDLSDHATNEKKWNKLKIAYQSVIISNIRVASTRKEGKIELLVVDEATGKPIKKARITVYRHDWNQKHPDFEKLLRGYTDEKGLFSFSSDKYHNLRYVVEYKNSKITGSKYTRAVYKEKEQKQIRLFMDRGVYRPGQTVYFKGIVFSGITNDWTVVPRQEIVVVAKDASRQTIFKQTFTTNSFGSINGAITLPEVGSLGNFQLTAHFKGTKNRYRRRSAKSFRVEEYKRPTFEVTLHKPKKRAQLNDSITVSGIAKAFACYPIENATISYTVYRKWTRYWWYRFYSTSSSGDLLKKGKIKSDEKGSFKIHFFAKTDPNATNNAYYWYQIKVKVTAVSGETHEKVLDLHLNKTGLAFQFNVPQVITTEQTIQTPIKVVNLSGEFQKNHQGVLKIYRKVPTQYFRDRIWRKQELTTFSKDDWHQIFPYMQWKKNNHQKLIKTIPFQSGDTLALNKLLQQKQGNYTFSFETITNDGDTVRLKKQFQVVDVQAKEIPESTGLWTYISTQKASVGETVTFQVGSAFQNAHALIALYQGKHLRCRKWVNLKKKHTETYTIQEKDRGGLTFKVILAHNGKFYLRQRKVNVPFDNKKLEIKTSTFTDLLEPGQKVHWRFQIKQMDSLYSAAELAAAMYDASLDFIQGESWKWRLYRQTNFTWRWQSSSDFRLTRIGYPNRSSFFRRYSPGISLSSRYSFPNGNYSVYFDGMTFTRYRAPLISKDASVQGLTMIRKGIKPLPARSLANISSTVESVAKKDAKDAKDTEITQEANQMENTNIQPRTNFNETAFFYPTIYANDSGYYVLDFTLPQSLTQWKLLLLAHDKKMRIGSLTKEIKAQKELMVTANAPRFVRQGDEIVFSAKVVNLTDSAQTVKVHLQLQNPLNKEKLDWISTSTVKNITISANSTEKVEWKLDIGESSLMQYTITASNSSFSDGERKIIPVLSNRTLVTTTDHILLKDSGKVTHTFEAFKNQRSSTLNNKTYTVEYIDNLAWEAVMALPYLSKINNQSATALVNSYFANALAHKIIATHPKIEQIFNQWKTKDPTVLWSELQKNEELKNILLKETPWVMVAKNETEQRRRIAQLFQLNQLQNHQASVLRKLKKRQNGDGGFSWFSGGKSNEYITTAILNRFAQLSQLGIDISNVKEMTQAAAKYLAQQQIKKYENYLDNHNIKQINIDSLKNYQIWNSDIYWLYSRLFFSDYQSSQLDTVIRIYQKKMKKDWARSFTSYGQALAGIYFSKKGMDKYADLVYASFQDRAKKDPNLGMYWRKNYGYFWYQNNIGTQAQIIAFYEQMNAPKSVLDEMRLWLITNKEANNWGTGVNTANAIYALLMSGTNYLKMTKMPYIQVGKKKLVNHTSTTDDEIQVDWVPGIGQLKHKWTNDAIQPNLGTITIDKTSQSPGVLNIYWQYSEELAKVKASQNKSMQIKKTYYKMIPGEKAEKGIKTTAFHRGDKIKVVLTVTTDRAMDFVHIKDLRPAGFEPKMAKSGHHWKNGLSYYESPKDASMNFFVEHLPKGTFQFSYYVYATHSGTFNSGMASVQCFYAPKFTGNSGTIKVEIGE